MSLRTVLIVSANRQREGMIENEVYKYNLKQ